MVKLKLKLTGKKQIMQYAGDYSSDYDDGMQEMAREVRKQGYLTKRQLKEVAHWKSPRRARYANENSTADVKSITRQALASKDDREKIKLLVELRGVKHATASAILHWFDKTYYPIWDFRALWSCSGVTKAEADEGKASFTLARWEQYIEFCRQAVKKYGVDKRISKEKQNKE